MTGTAPPVDRPARGAQAAATDGGDDLTWRIEVRGTVQGVGFRPFVYRLATGLGLRGDVRNAGGHVVITAVGGRSVLEEFVDGLRSRKPDAAVVGDIIVRPLPGPAAPRSGFAVLDSVAASARREIPPDLATCADCLRELFDPADRRYRYPFVNCTACGPRATIIAALPYDRVRTSMEAFPMCADCAREYHDPRDRRFHAEPIACPACGPRLVWDGLTGEDALRAAVAAIAGGGVVAIKGIGGYQFVCDATDEEAVARLRRAKGRECKPLAVMVRHASAARRLAHLARPDLRLLASPGAPIVLARAREGVLAEGVCGGMPDVGLFLPYSPLHHLLLDGLDRPLVVTSANRAGSPMLIDDAAAAAELRGRTDGVLTHDRPILARYDDSVLRVVGGGKATTVRRARGYAPAAMPLPAATPHAILAVGGHLKNTFTLAEGDRALIGPHIGDLSDAETLAAFEDALRRLREVSAIDPAYVAHDLHPAYLSTRFAARWPAERRVAVQHHHAHVAAVAAEHGLTGPYLGVAYDGLGLGDDGTFWGGELLLCDHRGYRRLGRFSRAPMPGGEAAVRRPARMALGYLFGGERFALSAPVSLAAELFSRIPRREAEVVARMIDRGFNTPVASSAGRLFDAVAALLGLCDDNGFEGEAAMRLERAATGHTGVDPLAWRVERRDGLWVYDAVATLRDLLSAAADGEPAGRLAAAFHATIAAVTGVLCEYAAEATGVAAVCLSGGVFQNRLLAADVLRQLDQAGFEACIGEAVPVNDGGISYGQAVVAAARLAAAAESRSAAESMSAREPRPVAEARPVPDAGEG